VNRRVPNVEAFKSLKPDPVGLHTTILETVVTVASICLGRSFAQSPKVDVVDLASTRTRTADHVASVDAEPLFVLEDKTPSSFPTSTVFCDLLTRSSLQVMKICS